jgi:hypothetical protein
MGQGTRGLVSFVADWLAWSERARLLVRHRELKNPTLRRYYVIFSAMGKRHSPSIHRDV